MLKPIHASEHRAAAKEKAAAVVRKLKAQKLTQAAQKVKESIEETLAYYGSPVLTGAGSKPTTPSNVSCVR